MKILDEGLLANGLPKIEKIRMKRNNLLAYTDMVCCNAEKWEAMTAIEKTAWREYKQVLRDFPSICDPENPVWPVSPLA